MSWRYFKGSNPDLLTEVTYGEHGKAPMMEKSGTGRMSPVRGRTMKEYDQQIAELKKENFNLKLRIYFLEERMNTKYSEEDVIKTNIELKVEVESYKKDLQEKQALLEKASETIDTLTSKYSEELEKEVINIKKQHEDQLRLSEKRAADLEDEMKDLEERLRQAEEEYTLEHRQLEEMGRALGDKDREIDELKQKLEVATRQLKEFQLTADQREQELMDKLDQLTTNIGRKDRDIQRLSVVVQQNKSVEGLSLLEKSHLQDEVEDRRKSMEKLQRKHSDQGRELERKSAMIGKLEDLLRKLEKEKEDLKGELGEMGAKYHKSKEAIRELVKSLYDAQAEAQGLGEKLKAAVEEKEKAENGLLFANQEKQKETEKLTGLEESLEKLARTLGKKEGELEGFRDLLQKAQQSLTMSEAAVESLEKQLEKERCRCKEKKDPELTDDQKDDIARLRAELDDLHVQLEERDQQYKDKCKELDTVASKLNITIATHSNTEGKVTPDNSDQLQQILRELQMLKGAVQSDRHVHIDINSHTSMDGGAHSAPENPAFSKSTTSTTRANQTLPHTGLHGNHSRIPVRRRSSTSSNPGAEDVHNLQMQVIELQARNKDLQNTLEATEETVHCQTRKMNNYKSMLVDHGILQRSRSNSESNIARLGLSPNKKEMVKSTENLSHCRGRSVSPQRMTVPGLNEFNQKEVTNDVGKLMKENAKLKQQVDGYKRVLKVFQGRSPSPDSDSAESGQDGEPAPIGSESAACMLETWLDMLDKFLMELSQMDQNGHSPMQTSPTEVSRIRRGLVQARGAIKSLSDTSVGGNTKGEGRLSPDSGCSDNNLASTQNDSLKSPLISPTHSTSPRASPRVNPSDRELPGYRPDCGSSNSKLSSNPRPGLDHCDNTSEINFETDSQHSDFSITSGSAPSEHMAIERLRHCSEFTNQGEMSLISQGIEDHTDLFGSETGLMSHFSKMPSIVNTPLERLRGNVSKSSFKSRTKFDNSVHPHDISVSDSLYERTFAEGFPSDSVWDKFDDSSLNLTLDMNTTRKNSEDMQAKIVSLEEMIAKYEEQIRNQNRPDMDSLQQHLMELRQLRIQLEKSLKDNENLERQLSDLYRVSDSTIQDQKRQIEELKKMLSQSQIDIREKSVVVERYKHTVERANTAMEQCQMRSQRSVETANRAVQDTRQQLEDAMRSADQYRERLENTTASLELYKQKLETATKALQQCQEGCEQSVESVTADLDMYKLKLDAANREVEQCKQACQEKVDRANAEMDQCRQNCKERVNSANVAVQQCKQNCQQRVDTLSSTLEQCKALYGEKLNSAQTELDRCKRECREKVDKIQRDTTESEHQYREKVESLTCVNDRLSTQLEQQRLKCADYKRQVERQNQLTKDLKERADRLREELTQATHSRESSDKLIAEKNREIQELTRLRDKYLQNLKVSVQEVMRYKRKLRDLEKKYENTSALNSSLQVELNVSKKLEKGDMLTDDEKQNMIAELLHELRMTRAQMTQLIEQNTIIKHKMSELLMQMRRNDSSKGKKDSMSDDLHLDTIGDHTWPSDLAAGWPRTDNLSSSLPLRDITHGTTNTDSRTSLPSQHSRTSRYQVKLSTSLPLDVAQSGLPVSEDNLRYQGSERDTLSGSKESLATGSSHSDGRPSSGGHFSVPGPIYKQGVTDNNLVYNVNDSPQYLAGLTQVRINSDLRSVFSVGMIDHFEKLLKETKECKVLLAGLATRISERLKVLTKMSATESIEYSTLKELSYSSDNMRICVDSQLSMLDCFWSSELPAPNERGEFVNQKLLDENSSLKERLSVLTKKYEDITSSVSVSSQRYHHEKMLQEEQIYRSLESTLDVVTRAKHNLQHKRQGSSPGVSPRKSSHGSHGSPIKSPYCSPHTSPYTSPHKSH